MLGQLSVDQINRINDNKLRALQRLNANKIKRKRKYNEIINDSNLMNNNNYNNKRRRISEVTPIKNGKIDTKSNSFKIETPKLFKKIQSTKKKFISINSNIDIQNITDSMNNINTKTEKKYSINNDSILNEKYNYKGNISKDDIFGDINQKSNKIKKSKITQYFVSKSVDVKYSTAKKKKKKHRISNKQSKHRNDKMHCDMEMNNNNDIISLWYPMNINDVLMKLSKSQFRSKFKLKDKELGIYYNKRNEMGKHAFDIITKRLKDKEPKNDGKQTPMYGHPVFIAQHATGIYFTIYVYICCIFWMCFYNILLI